MRTLLGTASLLAVSVILAPAAQTLTVTVHDLAATAFNARGNLQIKALATEEGSVGLAIARPGMTQTGHHHQQEQVVLALDRTLGYSVGGASHSINKYGALIPPSNSHHFYITSEGEPTTFIEYQPVYRTDWQPPFTAYKPLLSANPLPVPPGTTITSDLAPPSSGWTASGAARIKEFSGAQVKIVMIELNKAGTSVDMPASAAGRQFFYVLEGRPSLLQGSTKRAMAPHTVVEMLASAPPVRFESPAEGTALIALFAPIRRN